MTGKISPWSARMQRCLPKRLRTPGFFEFIRYAVIGGLTTAVNFGLSALLYGALKWDENLSNVIAVVCAVIFAYLANKWFVFRTRCTGRRDLLREAFSFFSARAATMLLEIGGLFLLVTKAGLPFFWIKAALTVLVVLINYVFNKRRVFHTGGSEKPHTADIGQ